MNEPFDFLIVGQGIAGTVLAAELEKRNCSFQIIDQFNPNASSQVAAGLINPITGRRIVKSWMADAAIPFAKSFYEDAERNFQKKFFHQIDALEVTGSVHELNEWTRRMDEQNMSAYFKNDAPNELYRDKIRDFVKLVRIASSGWLDMPGFTSAFRNKWSQQNLISNERFDLSLCSFNSELITYKENSFKRIIFCEGYKCTTNELWKDIPLVPAKGEIATIECKDLPQEFILLSGMFMIPIGNHLFRCGATYEWNFTDELPTEAGKNKLLKMIGDVVKSEWKLITHTSGVRPTVRDRRPIIGSHAQHNNIYIFNGMGTKGVMLAPYFAAHFADHLLLGNELDPEVNVNRFKIKATQ